MNSINYNCPAGPSGWPSTIIHTNNIQQTIHLTVYNFKISFPMSLAVKSTCDRAPAFCSTNAQKLQWNANSELDFKYKNPAPPLSQCLELILCHECEWKTLSNQYIQSKDANLNSTSCLFHAQCIWVLFHAKHILVAVASWVLSLLSFFHSHLVFFFF